MRGKILVGSPKTLGFRTSSGYSQVCYTHCLKASIGNDSRVLC